MGYGTLVQLGMGSVLLKASQKEKFLVVRAINARAKAILVGSWSRHLGVAASAVADLFRAEMMSRGNSAKALILRVGSAAVLSKS